MSNLNDDRPDVKRADTENTNDFDNASKAFAKFGTTLSEAVASLAEGLRKAITPKFVLVVLKHNYQSTPKWRIIRRYQLRRKIAEVERLIAWDEAENQSEPPKRRR